MRSFQRIGRLTTVTSDISQSKITLQYVEVRSPDVYRRIQCKTTVRLHPYENTNLVSSLESREIRELSTQGVLTGMEEWLSSFAAADIGGAPV